ncbi:thioesterase-like superfamily protein [Hirsutella rhossiliensis]|uniref:Thioesterase-like superfamily domain-containing protein n=1 Tax=Hirsutella rhossiliensis TaxID=111463 RepID=A0A9P8N7I9_9HYPO|nr:thioesterase-like superfamily domain-containing protein [Hirsutella rhossiliensis]KAH0967406.1 thioesterase-like superfamily domain-containing protein [Hirsutella rhossiliensis]
MPPSSADRRARRRQDYPYILDYRTRWNDNDMYDHMNNSVYNFLFDSAVNAYLAESCSIHPPTSSQHPLVAHTRTDYFRPIAYPAVADVALRVARLGRSSVTYELALFERGADDGPRAVCDFVHVFVDRKTGRPAPGGMTLELRRGLERICTQAPGDEPSSKI